MKNGAKNKNAQINNAKQFLNIEAEKNSNLKIK
jgi:hypothetical protein